LGFQGNLSNQKIGHLPARVKQLNLSRVAISDRQNRVNRGIFGSDWNSAGRARKIWRTKEDFLKNKSSAKKGEKKGFTKS
jgi:hypothetical protein